MYVSSGSIKFPRQTKIPLGLWHAAVYAQAHRCFVSPALWRARIHRPAECLDLSDFVSPHFASDGFDACLYVAGRRTWSVTTARRLFVDRAAPGTVLLRPVPDH